MGSGIDHSHNMPTFLRQHLLLFTSLENHNLYLYIKIHCIQILFSSLTSLHNAYTEHKREVFCDRTHWYRIICQRATVYILMCQNKQSINSFVNMKTWERKRTAKVLVSAKLDMIKKSETRYDQEIWNARVRNMISKPTPMFISGLNRHLKQQSSWSRINLTVSILKRLFNDRQLKVKVLDVFPLQTSMEDFCTFFLWFELFRLDFWQHLTAMLIVSHKLKINLHAMYRYFHMLLIDVLMFCFIGL